MLKVGCAVDHKPARPSFPPWFRQDLPDMIRIHEMKDLLRGSNLFTVCESAHCPNMGRCWHSGVATFMILGETCTRVCRFCAVHAGRPPAVDPDEPRHVALAVQKLNLRFVVVTSVCRDDLPDEGADQFAQTISQIRRLMPATKIEVLIPDFSLKTSSLQTVIHAGPEVISHNIETVRRLSPLARPQAGYQRSLDVLKTIRKLDGGVLIKSSLMAGMGETDAEIFETMQDLLEAGCQTLTIGQYLAPSKTRRHLPVERFVPPERFEAYRTEGERMGFLHVMSGPLVRSSYLAEEGFKGAQKRNGTSPGCERGGT